VALLREKIWDRMSLVKRNLMADNRGMVACVTCGAEHHWKEIDSGHYVPKSTGTAARYDWWNHWPQCQYCNRFLQGNGGPYGRWIEATLGREELERLEQLSGKTTKLYTADYLEMLEFWDRCVEEL
jgi:hypothetical protein